MPQRTKSFDNIHLVKKLASAYVNKVCNETEQSEYEKEQFSDSVHFAIAEAANDKLIDLNVHSAESVLTTNTAIDAANDSLSDIKKFSFLTNM